jgi:hypothetical protein
MIYRSDDNDWPKTPGPVFEYGWNHTTLRALKVDPSITYLQVRYGFPSTWKLVRRCARPSARGAAASRGDARERQGDVRGPALVKPSPRPSGSTRSCDPRGEGRDDLQPAPLHAGGRRAAVHRRAAADFKREADPKGLLNPGKMIAWDDPDFDYEGCTLSRMTPKPEAAE